MQKLNFKYIKYKFSISARHTVGSWSTVLRISPLYMGTSLCYELVQLCECVICSFRRRITETSELFRETLRLNTVLVLSRDMTLSWRNAVARNNPAVKHILSELLHKTGLRPLYPISFIEKFSIQQNFTKTRNQYFNI